MAEVGLSHDDCLDDHVNNPVHEKVDVNALSFELFQDTGKRSLVPDVVIFSVIIELKVFIVFVDCVVCQVLEKVFHVSFCGFFIRLSR